MDTATRKKWQDLVADLRAQLQQAQRKGTAAWLLFERRCDELRQAIERAERAEALAEERRKLLQRVINTRGCPCCGWADGRHPSAGCPYLAALTPAEAPAQRGEGDG